MERPTMEEVSATARESYACEAGQAIAGLARRWALLGRGFILLRMQFFRGEFFGGG